MSSEVVKLLLSWKSNYNYLTYDMRNLTTPIRYFTLHPKKTLSVPHCIIKRTSCVQNVQQVSSSKTLTTQQLIKLASAVPTLVVDLRDEQDFTTFGSIKTMCVPKTDFCFKLLACIENAQLDPLKDFLTHQNIIFRCYKGISAINLVDILQKFQVLVSSDPNFSKLSTLTTINFYALDPASH